MSHTLFVLMNTLLLRYTQSKDTTYYVNPSSPNPGNGLSWDTAFTNLSSALKQADMKDSIWLIGNQTYYPQTSNRSDCFFTPRGISIYGGFIGTETTIFDRPDDISSYSSILSGNINNINNNTDNCYHVITYAQTLTLDRLTITDGYANQQEYTSQDNVLNKYGSALCTNDGSQPTTLILNNIRFINNTAINGGALFFESNNLNNVQVIIRNSLFENNQAISGKYEGGYGGAIYLFFESNITVFNTIFLNNFAQFKGGAIYQDYGGLFECFGCLFDSNNAGAYGGALFSEDRNSQTQGTFPKVHSSQFNNNTAGIYGGAICFFNFVFGYITDTSFISNTAKFGGAISLIDANLSVDIGNTYHNNIALIDISTNNLYYEPDHSYSYAQQNLMKNATYYLESVYNKYLEIYPFTNIYKSSTTETYCYVNAYNKLNVNNQTGKSWDTSYTSLQNCIDQIGVTGKNGEIWVSTGIYIPTSIPKFKIDSGQTNPPSKSFYLYNNIRLYGGFNGTETKRSQRNFYKNPTYLSCKLGKIYCMQIMIAEDNTVIDGFIFINGGAQSSVSGRRRLAHDDALTIEDVLSSTAGNVGAGVYSNSTNIYIVNSIFYKLYVSGKGGAIYCIGLQGYPSTLIKSPTIINVVFYGNTAALRGGAIEGDAYCNFKCFYCIFDNNQCTKKGGAVYLDYNSDATFSDAIFRNNLALESGGCIAEDGESNTSYYGNILFINNTAKWEGGCLYSGSGVGPSVIQGFFFYNNNITFIDNNLIHLNQGQNDIYVWPYNEIIYYSNYTFIPTLFTTSISQSTQLQSTDIDEDNNSSGDGLSTMEIAIIIAIFSLFSIGLLLFYFLYYRPKKFQINEREQYLKMQEL